MWQEVDDQLVKEFTFIDFKTALGFVNKIGDLAESLGHHPDIELGWGRVKVCLTSHEQGCVTTKDKQLAKQIDNLKS